EFDELNIKELPSKVTLYSQTTMSIEKLYAIRQKLEEAGIRVLLKDTICRQVSGRKEDLQAFCRKHDVIIFISGVKSSNGKVLYEACRQVNPHCYKISAVSEIEPSWFQPGDTVGICGATSTPTWQMEQAEEKTLRL
ncbi:MAG: 4-hydroxy-3-methylbut-2-enyl diphosphate reductase, partial [Bacteroidales bacterium]